MNTSRILIVLIAALPLLAQAQSPAAEIALVTGSVTTGTRTLSAGDTVNAGDTLIVGNNSYANLKFADGGRILLRPNTEFTVEAFRPAVASLAGETPAAAAQAPTDTGQAFFRLVRGGFRAISGLIGKANRQSYRVTTSVATIGIRGTDYEVQLCSDDCPTEGLPKSAAVGVIQKELVSPALAFGAAGIEPVQLAASDLSGLQLAQAGGGAGGGMVVATNEGSIVLQTPRGEFIVDVGQVALTLANGQTFQLPAMPDILLLNQTPSPENCK